MGTEVHSKSYFPGYYSMRNLNEGSNGGNWTILYGDKALPNGQYYNDFAPRIVMDAYPGYDKNALKQKMLEHEAIFKDQVYELHRLYKIQRDMMDEIKRKELFKHRISMETSTSASFFASQMPAEDPRKWNIPEFQNANAGYSRPKIMGADVIESPFGCAKSNKTQVTHIPSQNGYIAKDCVVLESRPSKVRKRKFDLQLPAEVYIDTEEGEQFQDDEISELPSFSGRNCNKSPEGHIKLFGGGGHGKLSIQGDISSSSGHFMKSVEFADLNEPVQIEEATTSVEYFGHSSCNGDVGGLNLTKLKGEILEFPCKSHASSNGSLHGVSAGKRSGGEWFSKYGPGHNKGICDPVTQCVRQDKFTGVSHPTLVILDKADQSSGILLTDRFIREQTWRETSDGSIYSQVAPVASHKPSSFRFSSSVDVTNSWPYLISSREKPSCSFSQKLTSAHTHPSLNSSTTPSRTPSVSAQNQGFFRENWHANGSSSTNPVSELNTQIRNGLYHGSSESREISACVPSIGSINQELEKLAKRPICMDLKSGNDVNLNIVLPKASSNGEAPLQDLESIRGKGKSDHHMATLPWLKSMPSSQNMMTYTRKDLNADFTSMDATANQLCQNENVKKFNSVSTQMVLPASHAHKSDTSEIGMHTKKILGVPIFENLCTSKNEVSLPVSNGVSLHGIPEVLNVRSERKNVVIDINVACDTSIPEYCDKIGLEVPVEESIVETKVTVFRSCIDLNFCINEDEDPLDHSDTTPANTSVSVKAALEIDLEVPAVPDCEEDALLVEERKEQKSTSPKLQQNKTDKSVDDAVRIAAEAIVSISSFVQNDPIENITFYPPESSSSDPLSWFVDVVCCCDDLENQDEKGSSICKGRKDAERPYALDYFEAMTLLLTETKEEDYMPKPFIPEIPTVEEIEATSLANRTRRTSARRGRQRRDFRRDILPGLVSLSRHEVTEDLQTFGEIMRAAGQPWNLGLTRRSGSRNGAGRGRRRSVVVVDPTPPLVTTPAPTPLVQQLSNVETGLEDKSLRGWGKTTRRPRRQRCAAAGNPPIALT